ncbi:uncharacterized protein LOC124811014 isoform X1 [Hydra vulgaris]|uniref:uncharacterized protein LOC124811014 isoform X1 n=1 Tax=Hydra vulgaris TaxID=6087 RepID=UPI001F5ED974|nr:uncharacterized protein LOC124811014 [Hydra vulgaris]
MGALTAAQRYEKELKINNVDYKYVCTFKEEIFQLQVIKFNMFIYTKEFDYTFVIENDDNWKIFKDSNKVWNYLSFKREPKHIGLIEQKDSITINLDWMLGEDEIPLKLTIVLMKENESSEIVIQEIGKTLFELKKQCLELKNENKSMKKYFTYYNVNLYCKVKCLIYKDIFNAKNEGIIKKVGYPAYNDTTYPNTNKFNSQSIILYGAPNEKTGNGAEIIIPDGYNLLWVRILNDRWTHFNATFNDGNKENIGQFMDGFRLLNSISPKGISNDASYNHHTWFPIPVRRSGKIILTSGAKTNNNFWISGIAFGLNIWNIAYNSAPAYTHYINGGSGVTAHDNWNNDPLCYVAPKSIGILYIPVIPSKYDKLLYFVGHNDTWNENQITKLTVNDKVVDTFSDNYDNPIARHHNGKIYSRYYATLIPKELIPEDSFFLKVEFDMTDQITNGFYIRECGTHDNLNPFNIIQ